jgi:plasmid stability protein
MPVNLSIKGVPDAIAARLRARAARNHRSLQRELMVIVEVAAAAPVPPRIAAPAAGRSAAGKGEEAGSVAAQRPIEEVFEEWRKLFPRVRRRGPSGTEIIRKMRDGRFGAESMPGRNHARAR